MSVGQNLCERRLQSSSSTHPEDGDNRPKPVFSGPQEWTLVSSRLLWTVFCLTSSWSSEVLVDGTSVTHRLSSKKNPGCSDRLDTPRQ